MAGTTLLVQLLPREGDDLLDALWRHPEPPRDLCDRALVPVDRPQDLTEHAPLPWRELHLAHDRSRRLHVGRTLNNLAGLLWAQGELVAARPCSSAPWRSASASSAPTIPPPPP